MTGGSYEDYSQWLPTIHARSHGMVHRHRSATTAMQHIAIQESLEGRAVEWLEKVSDQEYRP